MVTVKDVAKEAGVTAQTVSNVMNKKGSVGDATRIRVLAAAKKLNYKPNRKAQAMRTGATKSIGLLLPDLTNPYFPQLAQSIELTARKAGFTVILFDSQGSIGAENAGISILEQHGVDGLIWCPTSTTIPKSIQSVEFPVILVDRAVKGFDIVQSDFFCGGILLAKYALKTGHRKIGMLSGPQHFDSAKQRKEGFISGIAGKAEILWEIEVPFSRDLPEIALNKLQKQSASLLVAGDDMIAIGAIKALKGYGIEVPEKVSVVGFDNIPWSNVISPELTTIEQPVGQIGAEAVSLLLSKIHNRTQAPQKIILGVKLIERDSVKRIKP